MYAQRMSALTRMRVESPEKKCHWVRFGISSSQFSDSVMSHCLNNRKLGASAPRKIQNYTLWPDSSEHIHEKSLVECSLEKVSSLHRQGLGPQQPFGLKGGCLRENRHLIYVLFVSVICPDMNNDKILCQKSRFLHIISNTLNHIFTKTVVWPVNRTKKKYCKFS